MKVTSVDLYSPNFSEAITFSLRENDPRSQYMVKEILGLDAEEIIARYYGSGQYDRANYYELGLKPRDIVFRIVLKPRYNLDESVSDIRDDLYRAISATRTGQISLNFNSGGTLVASINGFINKFEVPYFAKLPEVQLTVRCDDPMFRGVSPVVYKATELGSDTTINVVDSLSTAPHGFTLQVTFDASSDHFRIRDKYPQSNWIFDIHPAGGFLSGDVLYMSSEFSNKYLYILRSGDPIHLIDRLQSGSIWPIIFPGVNEFYLDDAANFNWDSLQFYAAYWGV